MAEIAQYSASLETATYSAGLEISLYGPVLAPELTPTLSLGGIIDQAFIRQLYISGGNSPTSWAIVGGADQLQYSITNAGVLSRNTPNTLEESEVVQVTAINSIGTSGTQTITIVYSEPTQGEKGIIIALTINSIINSTIR